MNEAKEIRAIVFKDGDHWVAQCLEYDIGAQAPDLDTLQKRLSAVLSAEFDASVNTSGTPFGGIEPAPDFFQNLWETRSGKLTSENPSLIEAKNGISLDLALCA